MEITIPEKLSFLFTPARYKVMRGGRGSAKSWSTARALLAIGMSRKTRVLCAREVQNSIRQSVHQLLKDQIEALGMSHHYEVLDQQIKGRNGTVFSFTGLSTLTVDTIKSFEGVDVCWVEEGQVISKRSWDILLPTIRKEGSEIWITYNPELETDETHRRFTIHPPPGTINQEMNWRDNPWFTDVLEAERQHCKETNPDDYDWIWEGKCKPAVSGAIYFKQVQEAETNQRIRPVPYDPALKVHVVLDLGWDDSLATCLVQRMGSEVRVIEYIEVSHTRWDEWSAELRLRPYNWGRVWLPHDGFSAGLNSNGKSSYDILKSLNWDVAAKGEIKTLSVEEGIRQTRLKFSQMYFDIDKCHAENPPQSTGYVKHTTLSHRLIECLKRYRRHINLKTETTTTPVHDIYAHGADCVRYVALCVDSMTNSEQDNVDYSDVFRQASVAESGGWMAG